MGSGCQWVVRGIVTFIGVVLLICLFIFMRGSSGGASSEISGSQNRVKNIATQDISLFHYTSLSDKVENYREVQGYHNTAKYCLLAVIIVAIILTVIYKCIVYKGKKKNRRRISEALEMTELHNDLLTRHGIVTRSHRKNEKKDEKRKRKGGNEEEEGNKEKKGRKKERREEEEDDGKQKEKVGEEEVTGDGAGDCKQKLKSKTKK